MLKTAWLHARRPSQVFDGAAPSLARDAEAHHITTCPSRKRAGYSAYMSAHTFRLTAQMTDPLALVPWCKSCGQIGMVTGMVKIASGVVGLLYGICTADVPTTQPMSSVKVIVVLVPGATSADEIKQAVAQRISTTQPVIDTIVRWGGTREQLQLMLDLAASTGGECIGADGQPVYQMPDEGSKMFPMTEWRK